jgi:CRP-like cAMP-binding protein
MRSGAGLNRNIVGPPKFGSMSTTRAFAASSLDLMIRKLQVISDLAPSDVVILEKVAVQERTFEASQDIVREGDRPSHSFVVLDGLVASAKLTGEGKRQITSIFVAGDLPDLHGLHLSRPLSPYLQPAALVH